MNELPEKLDCKAVLAEIDHRYNAHDDLLAAYKNIKRLLEKAQEKHNKNCLLCAKKDFLISEALGRIDALSEQAIAKAEKE